MTDLDKKHNDEALNVLEWKNSLKKPSEAGICCMEAQHENNTFFIVFTSNQTEIEFEHWQEKELLKHSKPTTIDNAKAQAELFILNLKR